MLKNLKQYIDIDIADYPNLKTVYKEEVARGDTKDKSLKYK